MDSEITETVGIFGSSWHCKDSQIANHGVAVGQSASRTIAGDQRTLSFETAHVSDDGEVYCQNKKKFNLRDLDITLPAMPAGVSCSNDDEAIEAIKNYYGPLLPPQTIKKIIEGCSPDVG